MNNNTAYINELKHKLRKLKKLELKIRFGYSVDIGHGKIINQRNNGLLLLWNEYFDLNERSKKNAKYTLEILVNMSKEEIKQVINEFLLHIYYRSYQEKGFIIEESYDPEFLSFLGLSIDADSERIKKRFRELSKTYHPDAGGDKEKFMELIKWRDRFQGK